MAGVRGREDLGTQRVDLAGGAEMHRRRGVQPDSAMPVLVVVVGEERGGGRPGRLSILPDRVRCGGVVGNEDLTCLTFRWEQIWEQALACLDGARLRKSAPPWRMVGGFEQG